MTNADYGGVAGTVSVIDGTSNQVTATIDVGDYSSPHGVAVDPSTHTVYVAKFGARSVAVIDGASNQVTATVGVGTFPDAVAVDPSTHRVYVTNRADDSVSVIDGTTNQVIATIDVGDGAIPRAIAVDPTTHTVYVAGFLSNSVIVIDGTTNQITTTIAVDSPAGVAVDTSTHAVYVSNYYDNSVSIVDGSSHQVTGSFGVGIRAYGVAVDSTTHTVYVANYAANSASVVDGATTGTVATLAVGNGPVGMAVDGSTHTAYATNSGTYNDAADINSVSVIDQGTAPSVRSVTPSTGRPGAGTNVEITGTDLTRATAVRFGAAAAVSFTVVSPNQIFAVAPAGPGTVDVRVTTPFGTSATVVADRYTYVKASPSLTTTPSSGAAAGGSISDSAVLSGGSSPSGPVTFSLFGPTDPTCTGTPVTTSTVGLSGSAADSGAVTVTAAGTYRWTTSFGGDDNNNAASTGCGDDTVVTPGVLDRLVASPALATVVAGGSQTFAVEGFDAYGNSRGDVTTGSTFTVVGGTCDGATCTPSTKVGRYTVTASSGGTSASATVRVTPEAADHLVVTPRLVTVVAGGSQTFAVTSYDRYGNVRSKVAAALSISGGGTCDGLSCAPPTTVGRYDVTASFGGMSASATVRVTPAAFDRINIAPGSTTIAAGGAQAYLVSAYDRFGNFRSKVAASLAIDGGGACDGLTCTPPARKGRYAVTASFGGKSAVATLRVTEPAGRTSNPGW